MRACDYGFGIETDVRDLDGELVIAHDMPVRAGNTLGVEEFLDIVKDGNPQAWLALNIKSDDLCLSLYRLLNQYGIGNYFVFDMSVPEMAAYRRIGMPFFTRRSDLELMPALLESSLGVRLDAFATPYFPARSASADLDAGKMLGLVSPELHNRPHMAAWRDWRPLLGQDPVLLCTDYPDQALTMLGMGK
ncbi:MAG: hypothetical protein MO847_11470 [Candidatus Protistobacter heckmanni]|nr:hypothetical protein [Candidatus Protistobacter heckmanni]